MPSPTTGYLCCLLSEQLSESLEQHLTLSVSVPHLNVLSDLTRPTQCNKQSPKPQHQLHSLRWNLYLRNVCPSFSSLLRSTTAPFISIMDHSSHPPVETDPLNHSYYSSLPPTISTLFGNLDDSHHYKRCEQALLSPHTRNFIVDFGGAPQDGGEAWCAVDLGDVEGLKRLLEAPVRILETSD